MRDSLSMRFSKVSIFQYSSDAFRPTRCIWVRSELIPVVQTETQNSCTRKGKERKTYDHQPHHLCVHICQVAMFFHEPFFFFATLLVCHISWNAEHKTIRQLENNMMKITQWQWFCYYISLKEQLYMVVAAFLFLHAWLRKRKTKKKWWDARWSLRKSTFMHLPSTLI